MRSPARAELQRVVHQVGHRAFEQLDVERAPPAGCRRVGSPRSATPCARGARARSAWRCRRAVRRTSSTSQRSWNCGSSSCARSPSDCTSRAALRVLRSATSTRLAVLGAGGVAGPAGLQCLQAGGGGGERRAQVVRQVADAFAAEVVEPAQRVPLRRSVVEHGAESRRQLAELVAGAAAGQPAALPRPRRRRPTLRATARPPRRLSWRSGRVTDADDPGGQQRGQRHDARRSAQRGPREAAAQRLPAAGGQASLWAHQVQVAGHRLVAADHRAAQRPAAITASASMRSGSSPIT